MEIEGKLVQVLQATQGTSARGEWKRQDFVIETLDQYPKKVCISNWNNKIDIDGLSQGDQIKVSINIESREYNGKWYTDVRAWKMEMANQQNMNSEGDFTPPVPNDIPPPSDGDIEADDLPF